MPNLSLSFFGAGRILDSTGAEISLRGRKEFALLTYLALEPENSHRREFLGGILWPEMAATEFRNNLRVTLSRLRSTLQRGGVDSIHIERQTVQFLLAPDIEIDTYRFQNLAREIDAHDHSDTGVAQCNTCFPKMRAAVDLYRGEFLAGFHVDDSYAFDDWLTIQRQHFHLRVIEFLETLEAAYIFRGEKRAAIETVRQRLALDPLQESAHRQLMKLMVRNGERHRALVQYESVRRLLDTELGVPPEAETVALYQQIREGHYTVNGTADGASVNPKRLLDQATDSVVSEPAVVANDNSDEGTAVDPHATAMLATFEAQLSKWATVSNQKLFGIEEIKAELLAILQNGDRPWLVSIDGIGGIGKTSIAKELSRTLLENNHFERVAWVSAKQEEFHADAGITQTEQPALDADEMVAELLTQLDGASNRSGTDAQQRQALIELLKTTPALVVVDNLETVADYQALVPLLVSLADPSKVIITSRLSLHSYPDVYARTLGELTTENTFDLLRFEASVRGISLLTSASDEQLQTVYDVVGGHPLALNLVLGQLTYLPMNQVLTGLQQARGERIEQLYSYIYWQAWQMLDDAGRQLLLTLPIVFNGTFQQLEAASLLVPDELQDALTQLMGLSLVQVAGDMMEPRYRLHRLTETFLMNEVLKWQLR